MVNIGQKCIEKEMFAKFLVGRRGVNREGCDIKLAMVKLFSI